ncbi:complement receptor type 1-like [Halichondria panicea]|uniref:complement receptor type 1-like n=1 Tax=Halichondria panicea TaxID=6063 RepID=UPI00312B4525
MPGSKSSSLCAVAVLAIAQVLTVNSTLCISCTAPLPYLQKIISHPAREIRYETVADLQNPLWCIDGVGAISSRLDKFGDIEAPEGHILTYTNPLSSDMANNKVLYLVDHATNNCTDINSAVEISSAVGNINSAILIMLHIVEATSCPKPPPLMNGRVSTTIKEDNSREIHTAVYSCDVGYYLDSNETRECVREIDEQIGQWTSSPPACISITCEVPTIANGTVTNSAFDSDEMQTNETVEYGTEIIYRCNAGFSLAGDYLPRTCRQSNNSGVWSGTAPYCKPNNCTQLSEINYGLMPEYRDSNDTALNSLNQVAFSVGTIASYGCQRGYKLSGNGTKECLLTGEWSSPGSVECKVIECPHLEKPLNGSISFSSNLTVDGVAEYTCNDGYKLDRGSANRTCSLDNDNTTATWDGYPAVCTQNSLISNMQEALNGTMNNGTQNCEPEHSKEVNDIWRAISIVMGVLLLLFGILGLAVFICVRKSRQTKEYPIHSNEAITHCPDVIVNNNEL